MEFGLNGLKLSSDYKLEADFDMKTFHAADAEKRRRKAALW